MRQTYFTICLIAFSLLSCTEDRDVSVEPVAINPESVLVHYWNFNSITGTVTSIDTDNSLISGAQITYPGTGNGYMDGFDPGYAENARNADESGTGFRARNPSDSRSLILSLPTTGYKDIVIQFATARTGSGATTQNYSYTVDGTNYTTAGLPVTTHNPTQDPTSSLVTLDFSGISAVENNSQFKIKISFSGDTASGTSGNNRFDNITLEGVPSN